MVRKKKIIPDEDHVVRYVPYSRQARDADDNLVGNGLLWSALQQRETEASVSVNWLEYHDPAGELSKAERLKLVRDDLAAVYPIRPKGLMAIGNVGEIKSVCADAKSPVRVTHEPSGKNLSHAGIRRLPTEQDDLLETLAVEVFADTVLAAEV